MVVPYSAYPTINQLIGLSLDTMGATTMGTTMGSSSDAADRATPQQHFLHLLQEAERRHRDTLQRAIHAEAQVQQLRQVFQQWQQQLQHQMQQQHQLQLQKLVDQERQQRQVQQQMQSLYDAVLLQQRQQTLVRRKVDEMVALQQQQQLQQQLQAFSSQQHLGQMQLQVLSLDRGQRAERRSRQALQRQVTQSRRWGCAPPPRQPQQQPSQLACALPALPLAADKPLCNQDDCCPCEFPEECPFNPCLPEDCCDVEIPEGPNSNNCLLRDIRLGLVQPASCVECESQWRAPREVRRRIRYDSETESGYDADDEASLFSAASSKNSSAFVEERRHILQEVRSLENTRLTPRYKETYKPLRCFHCGKLDHLATFCPSLPVTIL